MDEYIERAALIKAVRIMPRTIRPELVRYSTVQAIIDKQPAADVVEVVRCKDCKFLMFSDCYGECSKANMGVVSPDDFCCRGERRTDNG